MNGRLLLLLLSLAACLACPMVADAAAPTADLPPFPRPIESYNDKGAPIGNKLADRITAEPFNAVATAIFFLAIIHTFLASKFLKLSHQYERQWEQTAHSNDDGTANPRKRDHLRFKASMCHLLGEVEAVFGIWAIPLAIAIVIFHGWGTMVHYIDNSNYREPIFVFVIMAIASSRPILRTAEAALSRVAAIGGGSPAAWWLSILTVGPLLGSFITEPAAMTICALLLGDRFYRLQPGMTLRYATLGLLFVNISVGGTLSHFAAPPVVMVAATWNWDFSFMLMNFGWKAVLGIITANVLFFMTFRKELLSLRPSGMPSDQNMEPVPVSVTAVHLLIIAWTVLNSHHPALIIFGLLFFLAFVTATDRHQDSIGLRGPLLVGFFLAALVIHGGCQQWWIAPVLGDLGRWPLMIGSVALTAVNDNAAITFLASLVPDLTHELKYAVMAGAVTGGGLTVIANAPNPAGQSILQTYFGEEGINPLRLFAAALAPTFIMGAAFMLLP